ncbi:MAG: peptidase M28, partial [Chloroflexota bacterium]
GFQDAAGDSFDFRDSRVALQTLRLALDDFYDLTGSLSDTSDPAMLRQVNAAQRAIGRTLVALGYSRDGRFRQDPATAIPTLPDLAPAMLLPEATPHQTNVIRTHLIRGQNRLVWEVGQAMQIARQSAGVA